MKLNIWQVDAFTDSIFSGNYAAVVILDSWLADAVMQNIASENNVSETAFLVKTSAAEFAIRWFSPFKEIDFCGHATLAAAFVVFGQDQACAELTFTAPAIGSATLVRQEEGYIAMTFPSRKPEPAENVPAALSECLSFAPRAILKNSQAYFAVLDSRQQVEQVLVDLEKVKSFAPLDLVVTAADTDANSGVDFVSRYFWPANGGDEDPVTGSAHTALAPYWGEQLGKQAMVAEQVSQRSGLLRCWLEGDKVVIAGQAVLYLEGIIYI